VKRFLALFLIVLLAPLTACTQQAVGWEQQVKIPAEESHPEVLQAMEHMWQPTAAAATATMAAGSTQAASYAATVEAIQTLLPPVTPTLAPRRPTPHLIVAGDTFQLIMRGIGGCSMDEVAQFNNIHDINKIQVNDTIEWPDKCYLVGSLP